MPTLSNPVDFSRASFMQSAASLAQCPPDTGAEIAFAGRSNAGKSSAINAITRQSRLARISKTPGRTRLINFFALTGDTRLVDLPGYGFAKVSKSMKREWDRNLASYLQNRQSLRALVLLMDIRHPLQPFDLQMLDWSARSNLATVVVLTKADKLSHGAANNVCFAVKRQLQASGLQAVSVQPLSALKREGVDSLAARLMQLLSDPGSGESCTD